MHWLYAVTVGILYGVSFFLLLRRSLVRIAMGLIMISYASNLLIFVAGGLTPAVYPIVPDGAEASAGSSAPLAPMADPLPQALILTAIVISMAVLAFSLILFLRSHEITGSDDSDELRNTDR
jgi:multicomponent Na+:H+ antiporter subunit C